MSSTRWVYTSFTSGIMALALLSGGTAQAESADAVVVGQLSSSSGTTDSSRTTDTPDARASGHKFPLPKDTEGTDIPATPDEQASGHKFPRPKDTEGTDIPATPDEQASGHKFPRPERSSQESDSHARSGRTSQSDAESSGRMQRDKDPLSGGGNVDPSSKMNEPSGYR